MQPLLPVPINPAEAKATEANFKKMSVLFAINHGCVTSVLTLSVLLLKTYGSFMSGALYVMYAATALIAASAIVAYLGSRRALIYGAATYCVYIVSFPLALVATTDASRATVAIIGGGIGGIAAGFLWSAQGSYFAASAKRYAEASGESVEEANVKFAAIFGLLFLGFEVFLKLLPLGLKAIEAAATPRANATTAAAAGASQVAAAAATAAHAPPHVTNADLIVAIVYSLCAIASTVGMIGIWDLDQRPHTTATSPTNSGGPTSASEQQETGGAGSAAAGSRPADATATATETVPASTPPPPRVSFERAAAAVLLWRSHPTVLLLAPVQIAFGFCSALLADEVSLHAVPQAFPQNKTIAAGCLSALVALVAAGLQYPFKAASARFGKPPVMLAGLSAFGGLSVLCLSLELPVLSQIGPLVACFLLQGIGRACYEGTNKALYADFFADDTDAAFANIVLANGLASSIGFFTFPEMDRVGIASTSLAASCVAVVGYLLAEAIRRRKGGCRNCALW